MNKRRKFQLIAIAGVTGTILILAVTLFLLFHFVLKDKINSFIKRMQEQKAPVEETNTQEPQKPETEPEEEIETEAEEEIESYTEPEEETDPLEQQIRAILGTMTMDQKIGQLFIVTPEELTGVDTVTAAGEATEAALARYPVGGLLYFSGNIKDPSQLKEMTANTMSYSKELTGLPIFLSIDEEGGDVTRIASNGRFDVPEFDSMHTIGETGDPSKAYDVGASIGAYLSEYGINLDFAPVADVLTNSENTVVADRSFGSDPKLVSEMAIQVAAGLQDNGVYACMKHFPGHGATTEDSHNGAAVTQKTWEEMLDADIVPFRDGIIQDIQFLMVAHINAPNITGDDTPASLSSIIITEKLRNELGYSGIVVTDGMNMKAITDQYNSAQAAVKAIQAGADIILLPEDLETAYQGIREAVADGIITVERIDESLSRILRVKLQMTG